MLGWTESTSSLFSTTALMWIERKSINMRERNESRKRGREHACSARSGGGQALLCSTGFANWPLSGGLICREVSECLCTWAPLAGLQVRGFFVSGWQGHLIGWRKFRCITELALPSTRHVFRLVTSMALLSLPCVKAAFCFPLQRATGPNFACDFVKLL